jgi:hypothetical protein
MTLHVIGIIENFKSILMVQVYCAKDFARFMCCALRRGFCHAKDVVMHKTSSCRIRHHVEDVVTQKMSSRKGCFCA